jgi:hypothetical protein
MSNFNINNVTSFRDHTVSNGQVDISNDEYQEFLNKVHGDVNICGMTYGQGDALEALDPVAFRCGLGGYESGIQSELEEAIDNEDDSDIDWEDGKSPDELDALEEQE